MTRSIVLALALGLTAFAALVAGCSPSTELDGAPVPNSRPDTRVTAQPPSIIDAGFVVRFFWTGSDPDGQVVGYQWRISDNGTDGISIQDTLTFDPATGDTLNPWLFTTATDSVFFVSADIAGFPSDPANNARSFQSHSFWVRAVDDDGDVDPTPAYVSFTATTILPTIRIDVPGTYAGGTYAGAAPPAPTFGWIGEDPDYSLNMPTQVRYMVKPAYVEGLGYVSTPVDFRENVETLVSFSDSLWGPWITYDADASKRRVNLGILPQFEGEGENRTPIYYLFAVQARDTAGAVSVGRGYGTQVANFRISLTKTPKVRVFEPYLMPTPEEAIGTEATDSYDVAAGQPMNFSWNASAAEYAGEVISYRYGWDVVDPDDENDLGWAIAPGLSPQHRRAPTQIFTSGTHTLTIRVVDDSSQVTLYTVVLNVVPVPDRANQYPLLLVDDASDRNSQAWPSRDRRIKYDNDEHRDAFWEDLLTGPGGVDAFIPSRDILDSEDLILEYRTAVRYRVLLWTAKYTTNTNNTINNAFRPAGTLPGVVDKFIWLGSYLDKVGNVLLTGSRVMNQFLSSSNFMVPIVFQSYEERYTLNNEMYWVGWPEVELPDGTMLRLGPDRFPARVIGLAAIDQMSPRYNIYARPFNGDQDRSGNCAALKALVLDEDFAGLYTPGGGAIPDTIHTEPLIDWQVTRSNIFDDPAGTPVTQLQTPYLWGSDEFYDDVGVGNRPITMMPQQCQVDGVTTDCVEPMFRAIARYDWFRATTAELGQPDFITDTYSRDELLASGVCGPMGLKQDLSGALTNGVVVGFMTNKTVTNKPGRKQDVVWGFDAYRFDWNQMTQTVRWVLGEHFGLTMRP
ncbi:MAG: hypothetical protein R6X25_09815 [Candidatus Krumholzibacteriia bacterium]